jgi:putative transposase
MTDPHAVPDPADITPAAHLAALRPRAVRRLLRHKACGEPLTGHISQIASAHGVSTRTVYRWMERTQHTGTTAPQGRERFDVTDAMLDVVLRRRGNITAAHRELAAEADTASPPLPSLETFRRAVARKLSPGRLAGLKGGEAARRSYDVAGRRPIRYRNHTWETDHVEASVHVIADGKICKPWITWFVDCATKGICGLAITPHTPSRHSILVALRDAVCTGPDHRPPFGGVPEHVRVDGGKDFLSTVVGQALAAMGTDLIVLPPRRPDLKGTVEAINGAVKTTLFADLPGYTHAPTLPGGKPVDPDQDLLHFHAFTTLVINWVTAWNHEHRLDSLQGRTPQQAWSDDHTPIEHISPAELRMFTLERTGRPLTITPKGVQWKRRHYIADWMTGRVGQKVTVRYMPHDEGRIEVYQAGGTTFLGTAHLTDQATPAQLRALDNARKREAARLRADLKKAERLRKARYAPLTQPDAPTRIPDPLTRDQAAQQLRDLNDAPTAYDGSLRAQALPDLLPRPAPSKAWALPTPRSTPPAHGPVPDPSPAQEPSA